MANLKDQLAQAKKVPALLQIAVSSSFKQKQVFGYRATMVLGQYRTVTQRFRGYTCLMARSLTTCPVHLSTEKRKRPFSSWPVIGHTNCASLLGWKLPCVVMLAVLSACSFLVSLYRRHTARYELGKVYSNTMMSTKQNKWVTDRLSTSAKIPLAYQHMRLVRI